MSIILNELYAHHYQHDKRHYFGGLYERYNCRLNVSRYFLFDRPDINSYRMNEVLFGDRFSVISSYGDYSFIQLDDDSYCGWLPRSVIQNVFTSKNRQNKVIVRETGVYNAPRLDATLMLSLNYGSRVFIDSMFDNKGFVYTSSLNGWLFKKHLDTGNENLYLNNKNKPQPSEISPQEKKSRLENIIKIFNNSPYLLGGRTCRGIDCSAFAQFVYREFDVYLPRDSDMQEFYCYYHGYPCVQIDKLELGDLVFWPGHVAIALGDGKIVHASSNSMSVIVEPLDEVIQRLSIFLGKSVTSLYRILE